MASLNNKILFINPCPVGLEDRTAYPPLGLLYCAGNLDKVLEPEVYIMESEEVDRKNFYDYPYYGVSVHSVGSYIQARKIITDLVVNAKGSMIYVGGSGACMFKSCQFIHVFNGEGEPFFNNAVKLADLDTINYPARHLVPDKFIVKTGAIGNTHSDITERSTTMIATRGCVYNCTFCDRKTLGRKFRKRSVGNVIREVEYLKKRYDLNYIRFIDDCITFNKRWFAELCIELSFQNIKFEILSRADLIDEKLLNLMKRAGCQKIHFGFESGSQKILNLMRKHITVDKNIEACRLCKEAGIKSSAYMMFGFPGEDAESVEDTLRFLDTARPDSANIKQYLPIPQSDVWENPAKYNVFIKGNYEDYWCFDKREFPLEYKYCDDKTMYALRDRVFNKFYEMGYMKNDKSSSVRIETRN